MSFVAIKNFFKIAAHEACRFVKKHPFCAAAILLTSPLCATGSPFGIPAWLMISGLLTIPATKRGNFGIGIALLAGTLLLPGVLATGARDVAIYEANVQFAQQIKQKVKEPCITVPYTVNKFLNWSETPGYVQQCARAISQDSNTFVVTRKISGPWLSAPVTISPALCRRTPERPEGFEVIRYLDSQPAPGTSPS